MRNITLYHGTDAEKVEMILKEGLKPERDWWFKDDLDSDLRELGAEDSVFLAENKSDAENWGDVILEVTIPESWIYKKRLTNDAFGNEFWEILVDRQIPPEHIRISTCPRL